jgi:hypothetical protein
VEKVWKQISDFFLNKMLEGLWGQILAVASIAPVLGGRLSLDRESSLVGREEEARARAGKVHPFRRPAVELPRQRFPRGDDMMDKQQAAKLMQLLALVEELTAEPTQA